MKRSVSALSALAVAGMFVGLTSQQVMAEDHAAPAGHEDKASGKGKDAHGKDAHGEDAHGKDAHGKDAHGKDAHGKDAHGEDHKEGEHSSKH